MANAAGLLANLPVRMLIVGYPGAGKTSALAALANAGYKLRILAYDKIGNMTPLFAYVHPDKLSNIDIVTFEDKTRVTPNGIEPAGIPTAFANGMAMMERWKYKNPDGSETDLGKPSDWGSDTIVVLDTLTAMGEAAKRRVMVMMNKTPRTMTQAVWGTAQSEQMEFIRRLNSSSNAFHVIVLSHLVMVGPKDLEKDDAQVTKDLKERIAALVPTRLFPSALGKALPPLIGGEFPVILEAKAKYKFGKATRVLSHIATPELDLKLPTAVDIPSEVDVSDGLLQIFKALTPSSVAALSAQGSGLLLPTAVTSKE